MSMLDFAAFDAAPLQHDPFDFLVVPGFIKPDALEATNRDYPELEGPSNFRLEEITYGGAFGQLLSELQDSEVTRRIGEKFAVDLTEIPLTFTVRKYCEASDGHIHTDHWSKVITALLYFTPQWPHEGGRLRMLRSVKDIEDYAAEVAPLGGTLLAFRRTAKSFHGHKQFVGERRMMQMNWVRSSRASQYLQHVRGMTKRVKRLFPTT